MLGRKIIILIIVLVLITLTFLSRNIFTSYNQYKITYVDYQSVENLINDRKNILDNLEKKVEKSDKRFDTDSADVEKIEVRDSVENEEGVRIYRVISQ